MPRKEVVIRPGDELVIKVGKEGKLSQRTRTERLPTPRQEVLVGLRNFVRAHAEGISYLQSGSIEDVEAFTMDSSAELSQLLGELGTQHVSSRELMLEVQRVLLRGRRGEEAAMEAWDMAQRFTGYLQRTYTDEFSRLVPPARRGRARRG